MSTDTTKQSKRGGARTGAGRKAGTSPYGETTRTMRIPHSAICAVTGILNNVKNLALASRLKGQILFPAQNSQPVYAPLFSHKVPAGFPSPADDYINDRLSLDEHLIAHKEATFFVRAKGNSMVDAGIFDGDLLVVDKSRTAVHGNIVIAVIDGNLTVKRLFQRDGRIALKAENPLYKDIGLKDGQELQVWGVVTSSIKKFL